MLDALQQQLADIYHLGHGYDVRDFVITDFAYARALGKGSIGDDNEESLLISEDGGELALSLFLDSDLLGRVEAHNPLHRLRANMLDDFCKVIEGISHFSCVAWKATENRTLSLLELELQAEVDKFVATMRLAIAQSDRRLLRNLHHYLFENVSFRRDLDDTELDRYRSANDFAARYCYGLREALLEEDVSVLNELRHFYRLQLSDKISHIRAGSLTRSVF